MPWPELWLGSGITNSKIFKVLKKSTSGLSFLIATMHWEKIFVKFYIFKKISPNLDSAGGRNIWKSVNIFTLQFSLLSLLSEKYTYVVCFVNKYNTSVNECGYLFHQIIAEIEIFCNFQLQTCIIFYLIQIFHSDFQCSVTKLIPYVLYNF